MIYLVRHMQSEANVKRIWGGDYPLTDKGIKDAEILRDKIKFYPDVLVVSSLIRAQQTAKILFPKNDIITDNRFREIYFGNYENTVMNESTGLQLYQTKPSMLHKETHGDNIKERADNAILAMLDYAMKGTVVIVCHDTLIRGIICRLKGEDIDKMPEYKTLIPNGCVVAVDLPDKIEILSDL